MRLSRNSRMRSLRVSDRMTPRSRQHRSALCALACAATMPTSKSNCRLGRNVMRYVGRMRTAGIILRPFLDGDASEGVIEERAQGGVMVYSKLKIRAFVISATDAREGWPAPEIIATPGMDEGRAAPRRRVWL